jgi:hypothetical protein
MTEDTLVSLFLKAANEWLCDGYHLTVRYLVARTGKGVLLIDASLHLYPLAAQSVDDFHLDIGTLIAGQRSYAAISRRDALAHILRGVSGDIQIGRQRFHLNIDHPYVYSEMLDRTRWFSDLHIQISGTQLPAVGNDLLLAEDAALRTAPRPYDGLTDLSSSLGLKDRRGSSEAGALLIRVGPPIDLNFANTSLEKNQLRISLIAVERAPTKRLKVGIRNVPGQPRSNRLQVADAITWHRGERDGLKLGSATIKLENADSVLVMMTLGTHAGRRQWILDPVKATNTKLVATQLFDRDLKQLRLAVLEATDSAKFELGVSSLMFLMGFFVSIQLETNAPDLIGVTPSGTFVLVECTLRIAEVHAKLGKLVDRKQTLLKTLEESGSLATVEAILVTSQARSQVAIDDETLSRQAVTLLCGEQLAAAFNQLRFPSDADKLIDAARTARAPRLPIQ